MAQIEIGDWKEKFIRYATRSSIEDGLLDGLPLRDVINNTRHRRKRATATAEQLLNEVFPKNPHYFRAAEQLYEEAGCRKLPGAGLIIMGSAVHGGAQVREMLDRSRPSDIDVGLCIDDSVDPIVVLKLAKRVSRCVVPVYSSERPMGVCSSINPLNNMYRVINPHSGNLSRYTAREMLLLLQPTVPSEIGDKNRSSIISYLEHLSTTNRQRWEGLVDDMYYYYLFIHRLKEKHFAPRTSLEEAKRTGEDRSRRILEEVLAESADFLSHPFSDWLDSTDLGSG